MVTKQFFKNKRVTVFGLGLNGGGVATVQFLAKNGAKEIIVTDIKRREDLASSIALLKHIKNITYVLGQHRPEDFTRVDMVVVNPGISWSNEYVKLALKKNIPVEMDASIFFQLCPCPIIGVTGTKGKTTTSSLITEILKVAKLDVISVGIGQVPVLNMLEKIKSKSVVVFELSSWRLSSLAFLKKSPHIGVMTNIFPDHLNYYKNMAAYVRDKKNICAFQTKKDWLIVNKDNEMAVDACAEGVASRIDFSEHHQKNGRSVFVDNGEIVYRTDGTLTIIASLAEIKMRGKHNIANILAAVCAALAYGVSISYIKKAITCFKGVEHRLEFVREKNGVKYYNDTAATVPEAAIMAIHSFDEPVVIIVGGNNKGLHFEALAETIANEAKDAVFFKGEATDKIIAWIRKFSPETLQAKNFEVVDTMQDAVNLATTKASAQDVIVLSPGATSFGIFKNEFDRGEQFRAIVKKL